jgi:hypothetical protein
MVVEVACHSQVSIKLGEPLTARSTGTHARIVATMALSTARLPSADGSARGDGGGNVAALTIPSRCDQGLAPMRIAWSASSLTRVQQKHKVASPENGVHDLTLSSERMAARSPEATALCRSCGACYSFSRAWPRFTTEAGTARIAAAQGARRLGAVQAAAWTRPRASARRLFTHGAPFQARWSVGVFSTPSRAAGQARQGPATAISVAPTQGKAHPFASPGSRQQRRSSP